MRHRCFIKSVLATLVFQAAGFKTAVFILSDAITLVGRGLVEDSPPESAFTPEFCICQTVLHLPTALFCPRGRTSITQSMEGEGENVATLLLLIDRAVKLARCHMTFIWGNFKLFQ